MTMSADLRDRLRNAQVAGGAIYRDERPQGTGLPAVVLQIISDPRPTTHDGLQTLRSTRVQADCMAGSRGDADRVAEAVIAAALPAEHIGETSFSQNFVAGSRTYSDRDDANIVTYVTSLDLIVWHQPAA